MAIKKTATKRTKSKPAQYHLSRISPEAIEKLAYELWEKRGRPFGDGTTDWLDAERLIKEKININ